jgi:DNA invertase Pin-like site-specific DNA recombinase
MTKSIVEISREKIPMPMPSRTRVCAYVRVSTGHEGQLKSLENQTEYYQNKFSNSPHYSFVGVFSDAGISGSKSNRPGFQEMLTRARAGEIDLIFTKSISRFARSTLMLLEVVRELRDIGVGVIFEEQNINTLSSEGEMMLTILASIAEEERKAVCSNVAWAMQNKFKRGEVLVDTNRLLGYDKDENGHLVINEEEAEIVRLIFKLYLQGLSSLKIVKILNDEGVPSYTGNPWITNRILSIIANEKYVGDMLQQKAYVNETGSLVRNWGQMPKYFVKDSHPGIISREDWEKVQEVRKRRRRNEYPLTSLIKCPYCGASLTHCTDYKKRSYWHCYNYLSKGKSFCKGMNIWDSELLEMTKDLNITQPLVLVEVDHEEGRNISAKKNFRLVPTAEYRRSNQL